MPKYYVRSGHLEKIVTANSPEEAAYFAVCRATGEELDIGIYIDERGFRGPTPQDQSLNQNFFPDFMLTYNN